MRRWDRTWFDAEDPSTLLLVRWIVFTAMVVVCWRSWGGLRDVPVRAETLWEPISLLAALRMPPPAPWVVVAACTTVVVGSVLTLLRVAPRWTGGAAALAFTFLALMANSLGKISHDLQPLVVMGLVLAVAPVPSATSGRSWRWHWPVQLCRAALGVMLASAAASKLGAAGLTWATSENLRNILVMESQVHRQPALADLAVWVAAEPWRWQAAAAGALVGEAVLVLALVVAAPRLRAVLVTAGLGTLAGITLLIGLVGFPVVALGAVFASPRAVRDAVSAGRSAWRALLGPLLGFAALGATLLLHARGPTVAVLPLVAGAVVLVRSARTGSAAEVVAPQPSERAGR